MMSAVIELDIEGPAAPPRANGELVFAEPWESRAFGLAMSLNESGVFTWDEFREELIAAISSWEQSAQPGDCYSYYQCWLTALERISITHDLIPAHSLRERAQELADRPAGYDHGHDHDHDHDHDDHDHDDHDH
jgi:nitrile hydratase accessory protein